MRIRVEHAVQFTTTLELIETMEDPDTVHVIGDDKQDGHGIRIDIYIGSNTANGGRLVQDCEDVLTPSQRQAIIRNVGSGFPVDRKCSYDDWTPCIFCSCMLIPIFRPLF